MIKNSRHLKFKAFQASRKHFESLSFIRLLPNIATVMALCMGLTAVRFALQERYEMAVAAILFAAVLDAMDGRLARLLKAASDFGAELDSLSDFISFGVAPALVLYIVVMQEWHGFGWGVSLFFSACMAFRLARFNIMRNADKTTGSPSWKMRFFTGVPAPAGAMIALLPLMGYFATHLTFLLSPAVVSFSLILSGTLMISRLPTFSLKSHHIPRYLTLPILLGFGLAIAALISEPWITLSLAVIGYISTIPLASLAYAKIKREKESPSFSMES